ncbi:hypothetical protein [Idiomarina aminovorans]|uniref:hypothetical protein n=1 Tax=Idiomarina aminovorans TaxID=2914829 RepID=UPI00200506F6|nr:hypothetical protein [Idiomarina sp. ATCH4]MCK7460015.1 hypothetical protein [Idiomarina sp. ATCH4]
MTLQQLAQFCREQLGSHANKNGGIFYSKSDAFKKGDIYLLGYNPGGDSGQPIIEELDRCFEREQSFYKDVWQHRAGTSNNGSLVNRDVEKQTRYQRGVISFIDLLGFKLEQVCASNLIFFQSHSAKTVNHRQAADLCWPIHEVALSVVRPRLIVAIGNGNSGSAYSEVLRRKRHNLTWQLTPTWKSNYSNWRLKAFKYQEEGQQVVVLGLPHLSFYSVHSNQQLLRNYLNAVGVQV